MLLSAVKISITKNLEQSYSVPADDVLAEKVYEALFWVATECEPSELIRSTVAEADERVLRLLPGMKFIVVPEKPDFANTSKHLMIDEMLSYAVINFTSYLLSGEVKYKALCDLWVSKYRINDLNGFGSEEISDDK